MAKKTKYIEKTGIARIRYDELRQTRDIVLERAQECAKYTLPILYPPDMIDTDKRSPSKPYTPYQGIGAIGVNNLASKLLLTLFPPNAPMFRMVINDYLTKEQMAEEDPAQLTETERKLSLYERIVQAYIESCGDRPALHEAILHLLVAGNVLMYDDLSTEQNSMRVFTLNNYVVNRDPMGEVVELAVKESIYLDALADGEFKDRLKEVLTQQYEFESTEDYPDGEKTYTKDDINGTEINKYLNNQAIDVYTYLKKTSGKGKVRWAAYQEACGLVIPGTEAKYRDNNNPWLPLRLYWVAGEDYGRSFVANYLGDLKTLEGLSQAIIEATAISARVVFLVNPNGATDTKMLSAAPNGGYVPGIENEITVLRVDKGSDLTVAYQTSQGIERRLSQSFLLIDGMRRDAERVTAEEIRAIARELEATFGGIYSLLGNEWQLPYVKLKIWKMNKFDRLPELPEEIVEPAIVTGFEALGRGNDKAALQEFLATTQAAFGPEVTATYLNIGNALNRLALADGIDTTGLIKTDEELAAEQQAAQQAQQAQQANELTNTALQQPELVNAAMGMMQGQQIQ